MADDLTPFEDLSAAGTILATDGVVVSRDGETLLRTTVAGLFTNPALSGVPTAPTATAGTSTTQIATTAFVAARAAVNNDYADAAAADALADAEAYADGLVSGLLDDRGNFDASGGAYPSSGGSGTAGAIMKGDVWTISVGGTLPTGQVVAVGDMVRALVDTPGNTQANWAIAEGNIGYTPVRSVNGVTGADVSLNGGYVGVKGADIASAGTTDLATLTGDYANVTGTTTITAFGTLAAGIFKVLRFTGILTLTHNGTSLILPTAANITTAAGDVMALRSLGSGNWVCVGYMRADGTALSGSGAVSSVNGLTGAVTLGITPLSFTIDTSSTTDADPGNGNLRFNNATQASATVLFIDNQTADAISLTTYYASLAQNGFINIVQANDPTKWHIYKITAVTSASGYYKLTVVTQATGGSFSNGVTVRVTIQAASSSTTTQGKHGIPIMAGGMRPTVANGCANLIADTSGSNQPDLEYLSFDKTTQEYARFSYAMPKSWNEGTVTYKAIWAHDTATTYGVAIGLQAVAIGDNETIAANYGTAQVVTDTGGTTDRQYITAESSAITIAGTPQAEDVVYFRVYRDLSNGSDDLDTDMRLLGIILYITTDADNDA